MACDLPAPPSARLVRRATKAMDEGTLHARPLMAIAQGLARAMAANGEGSFLASLARLPSDPHPHAHRPGRSATLLFMFSPDAAPNPSRDAMPFGAVAVLCAPTDPSLPACILGFVSKAPGRSGNPFRAPAPGPELAACQALALRACAAMLPDEDAKIQIGIAASPASAWSPTTPPFPSFAPECRSLAESILIRSELTCAPHADTRRRRL